MKCPRPTLCVCEWVGFFFSLCAPIMYRKQKILTLTSKDMQIQRTSNSSPTMHLRKEQAKVI